MNSRYTTKKVLGTVGVFLLAVLVVPAAAGADKTTKPAPAPPPAKAAPPPARPAPQPAVRPAPAPQPRGNPVTPTGGGGGVRPNAGGSAGGARPAGGGITGGGGVSPNAGGSAGGTRPAGGGITGTGAAKPPVGIIRDPVRPTVPPVPVKPTGPTYHPPVGVKTTSAPGGGSTYLNTKTNTRVTTDSGGHVSSLNKPGLDASHFRADGRPGHLEQKLPGGRTMTVDRPLRGDRRVEGFRPGGVRVVTVGRRGFVERPFRPGYVSRTYVIGGRTEVRVYRRYTYGSISYYNYVPRAYYQPAFYAWAASPWAMPVSYAWGWGPMGWFGFYGGYFGPEAAYPSASLWLTDYLLAENLRQSYEDRQSAGEQLPPQDGQGAALTPEVKQAIADEVSRELADERAAAAQPPAGVTPPQTTASAPPPALKQHIFIVSTSLDLNPADGGPACAVTAGDIIERTGRGMTQDGKIAINVLNSKSGDCQADTASTIELATLQDMQNQYREQLAAGTYKLAKSQGQGLPSGPPAGNPRQLAEGQAPPDADAQTLVMQQNQDADRTESEIKQSLGTGQ